MFCIIKIENSDISGRVVIIDKEFWVYVNKSEEGKVDVSDVFQLYRLPCLCKYMSEKLYTNARNRRRFSFAGN